MLQLKTITSALILILSLFFSENSFAFNTPQEFILMGTQSAIRSDLYKTVHINKRPYRTDHIKAELMKQYSKWKGTRYHWGGSSQKGIDCSALMQHIFNDSFRMYLPRTTVQQIKNGMHVDKNYLKAGDLVFFRTKPDVRHVGVYIGNKQFIHASSSKGVTISSLANEYWDNRYETARRITL